jgi:hypothetical protein
MERRKMALTGRKRKEFDVVQLKAFLRLKPTLEDCAAFFACHSDTVVNFIKREFNMGFSEFREQNAVHTRFNLIRKAISKAEHGDNVMLIFCLKNLCNWRNDPRDEIVETINLPLSELITLAKAKILELDEQNNGVLVKTGKE